MDLDLVHRRHRLGLCGQPLEVLDLEVGYPYGASTTVAVEPLERFPGGDEIAVVASGQRPVDEEQVHVVEAKLRKRPVERLAGGIRLVSTVAQLAGDEYLTAVEP